MYLLSVQFLLRNSWHQFVATCISVKRKFSHFLVLHCKRLALQRQFPIKTRTTVAEIGSRRYSLFYFLHIIRLSRTNSSSFRLALRMWRRLKKGIRLAPARGISRSTGRYRVSEIAFSFEVVRLGKLVKRVAVYMTISEFEWIVCNGWTRSKKWFPYREVAIRLFPCLFKCR